MKLNNQKLIRKPVTIQRTLITSLILFLLLIITAAISLSMGQSNIDFASILGLFTGSNNSEITKRVFYDIRLPRVLLAILVGGGLSIAGVVFQALLKNTLAEPYILGISSGASVGTLIAIMIGFNFWYILTPVFAFPVQ